MTDGFAYPTGASPHRWGAGVVSLTSMKRLRNWIDKLTGQSTNVPRERAEVKVDEPPPPAPVAIPPDPDPLPPTANERERKLEPATPVDDDPEYTPH